MAPTRFEALLAAAGGPLAPGFAAAAARARARVPAAAPQAALRDVAAGVAAPMLVSYAAWILRDAARRGLARVYFLARDGQVLFEIARAARAPARARPRVPLPLRQPPGLAAQRRRPRLDRRRALALVGGLAGLRPGRDHACEPEAPARRAGARPRRRARRRRLPARGPRPAARRGRGRAARGVLPERGLRRGARRLARREPPALPRLPGAGGAATTARPRESSTSAGPATCTPRSPRRKPPRACRRRTATTSASTRSASPPSPRPARASSTTSRTGPSPNSSPASTRSSSRSTSRSSAPPTTAR